MFNRRAAANAPGSFESTASAIARSRRNPLVWSLGVFWLTACHAHNYIDPSGPRFAHSAKITAQREELTASPTFVTAGNLRVVTFNIKFAKNIDGAIRMFRTVPNMMDADIVLLQEMDESGVLRVAEALGFENAVYYPATLHPQSDRNFGNAILSRWPIEEDQKLLLPHLGQFGGTLRIAVRATVRVGEQRVRVYSLHLATRAEIGPNRRREQAGTIMADADASPYPVIIAGDVNGNKVWKAFEKRGYRCVTHGLGNTAMLSAIDHIFVRGIGLESANARGKVQQGDVSDHAPVWAVLKVPGTSEARSVNMVQRIAD